MDLHRSGLLSLICLMFALSAIGGPTVSAETAQKSLAKRAILKSGAEWLESQQDDSGGFPDLRGDIDPGVTAEVVSTLIALRNTGLSVDIDAALLYLESTAPANTDLVSGGDAKVVVALVAAGVDPRDIGVVDMVARVLSTWDETVHRYGVHLGEHAYALMALQLTGEVIPDSAIDFLTTTQMEDGSWSVDGSNSPGGGNAVITSFVIQALVATGHGDDPSVQRALGYFHSLQSTDGAFSYSPGAPPDSNTTGFVISALTASGENPKSADWNNAVAALLSFQSESGGFRFDALEPGDDILSTIPALIALSGAVYPVLPISES